MDWLAQAATAARSAYGRTSDYLTLGNLVSISWVSIWVVICVLIFQDLSRDLVTIEPISTPEAFANDGYTPEVASRRLHDALNTYADNAGSLMRNRDVESREELPDFVVPKIDLSLNAIVASIRSALHYGSGQRITGEFISRDGLLLRVRVDGQEVFSGSGDPNDPDKLLAQAAPFVMDKIRPYLVASTLYRSDPKRGVEKADYIINHRKSSDVNVQWSYVLKGRYLIEQNQLAEAENILRIAIPLNWSNATAHLNLGFALFKQDRIDEAISQYERAIAIDPIFSLAHNDLGAALDKNSKPDEAIVQYQEAIKIDPTYCGARANLAGLFSKQQRFDDAISQYRSEIECAKTGRELSIVHNNLGNALLNKPDGKIEATEEYRLAIVVDPDYSPAHYNLGMMLSRQGRLDEAIDEYKLAVTADPNNAKAKANLEALRDKLADQDKRTEQGKEADAAKQ
jgi:tetratricopeptide (TPR) repeat protein